MKKATKIIIGSLAVLGVLGVIGFGLLTYMVFNVDNKYTGQEMFDAINEYRASIGVQQLELDPVLCDNLVARYLSIKNGGKGHDGFEEWVKGEGIDKNPKYGRIGEMYATATQTYWAIDWWKGSPGHRDTLEMPSMKYGCSYALDGFSVTVMAEPNPNQQVTQ